MKSALFVDVDNVFTQLRALQPAAAERFARQPGEWIRWLSGSLEIPGDHHDGSARRRLLVRRCYLNPNWYQGYRYAFLRAGFEIVDCPPVTSQGKTSTDIHMVLDIVDLLQHETRYDEFIVLSADADFTPVLRKLRRHDRRTSVLAIGFPSAAYQACADLLIDERLFVEQALGLAAEPAEAAERPVDGTTLDATTGDTGDTGGKAAAPAGRRASADELAQIAHLIETAVAQSPVPVAAGALASRLRQGFAPLLDDWCGHGSFKPFFRSLGLGRLLWISGSGGRIADPARHAVEPREAGDAGAAGETDAAWGPHAALLPLAREISQLTGAPLLPPPTLRAVLDALCADLATHPYEPTETARRVHAACADAGLEVSLREVVFILRGMQLNGHVFGRGQDDPRTLTQRLYSQLLFLCQREQMVIDEAARAQIRQWIGADLLA
ncbi:MAG: NYN domain-containing protein [Burkholderiaceae bacterium]|nr:NYN domain-containing protein [Burkholderiaceae bacterium]